MVQVDYLKVLSETGIDVDRPLFRSLSEDAKFQVTDDVLTGMMKFITDKYNALDFGEIERSAGDIEKFKYRDSLPPSTAMRLIPGLRNIWKCVRQSGMF